DPFGAQPQREHAPAGAHARPHTPRPPPSRGAPREKKLGRPNFLGARQRPLPRYPFFAVSSFARIAASPSAFTRSVFCAFTRKSSALRSFARFSISVIRASAVDKRSSALIT